MKRLLLTVAMATEGILCLAQNPTKTLADTLSLDEVFVVAYGTAKKSSYSGSASVVRSEVLQGVPRQVAWVGCIAIKDNNVHHAFRMRYSF